jgi:hypothetical protein
MLNRVSYKSPGRSWISGDLAGGSPPVGSIVGVCGGDGKVNGVKVIVTGKVGEIVLIAVSIGAIIAARVFSDVGVTLCVESIILHATRDRMINE